MNGCQSAPAGTGTGLPPVQTGETSSEPSPLREQARALYEEGLAAEALEMLSAIDNWQGEDYLLVGEICVALEDYACSADGYIQASLTLATTRGEQQADLNERIWYSLDRARRAPQLFTDANHRGWWLLQQAVRRAGSPAEQQEAWSEWADRHPGHPAVLAPPSALTRLASYESPDLAVFLPLSGPMRTVGHAVRDGLLAGYLADLATDKSSIRFYDTHEQALGQLYERALADGAEVTVGPLLKQNADQFLALTRHENHPGLLLNYTDEHPEREDLFRFGIAIEDEADALALKTLEDGHQRILVVTGTNRWSRRAADRYLAQWPYPTSEAAFTDIKNLTQAIGGAMQTEASEGRKNQVARILGEPLEFIPRARRDLDAVVAFTSHVESRALRPALQFHFAESLPVYATSQSARGTRTNELADFGISEMPIFVNPGEYTQLRNAFELDTNSNPELYALGFDAYRLANWVPLIRTGSQSTIAGASGYLWLDQDGSFRRELMFAKVSPEGTLVANP